MILTKPPGCRPTFSHGESQIISLASALEQLHHLHVGMKDVYFYLASIKYYKKRNSDI